MSEKNYFEDREMRRNRIRNSRRRKTIIRNSLAIGAGCALLAGSAACAPDFLRGRYKKSSYPRRSTSSPDPADKGGPPVLSNRR